MEQTGQMVEIYLQQKDLKQLLELKLQLLTQQVLQQIQAHFLVHQRSMTVLHGPLVEV